MQSEKDFLKEFEEHFEDIQDPRQQSKVAHPLIEILFLAITAVAARAPGWASIELFGNLQLTALQQYYPFRYGIPSKHTIRRVFEVIDPKQMSTLLLKYFGKNLSVEHYAIDGKTLNGSRHDGIRALHFLNVYAVHSGLTIYGQALDKKQNEISAIPEVLDLLNLEGSMVTIDAMGCQKNIAAQIIEKKADYILGLKKNHIALQSEVERAFQSDASEFCIMDITETHEKGHGRIETRKCRMIRDISKINGSNKWPGLQSVIEIYRHTIEKDKVSESVNYYISSSLQSAEAMLKTIRAHWKIESMHWSLDVSFNEDASGIHKDHAPSNIATVRRFILNILSGMKGKNQSRPDLMKAIGWSQEYLHKFVDALRNYS